jgi:hypothetical protein
MMAKSLWEIGRNRQGEQHKMSVYMGKEEVWERIWLI